MSGVIEYIKQLPGVRHVHQERWFGVLLRPYHFLLAFFAALKYGFPSRRMTVIGVTGTKGKTTTSNVIAEILESSGRKTGLATTVNFRIGEKEWVNDTKQTMLGRFALQKLLRDMADAGCRYAVIETSSEGIAQYRHRFIDYDIAVFTNLSPEHIERHGSFEKYRDAKRKLFAQVAKKKTGIGIYNLDDPNAEYFVSAGPKNSLGYSLEVSQKAEDLAQKYSMLYFPVLDVSVKMSKSKFTIGKDGYETTLVGEFNVRNAVEAFCVGMALDVPIKKIQHALQATRGIAGRFEIVNAGQQFTIVVDYAHEPASLEAVYKATRLFKPKNLICLLGAQGGGRDVWKRKAMGKIAGDHCDQIILTNEDPYDEDPMNIINDIDKGIAERIKKFKPVYKIPDRRDAIRKALLVAKKDDAVLLTGKGGEVWMCIEKGRKIAWNERHVVETIIAEEASQLLTRSSRSTRYDRGE